MKNCDTWPRILSFGTDFSPGPQKVWLAIFFPLLLPTKLTACQGRNIQQLTASHYTTIPGIAVSIFSYRCTQSAFLRSMENQIYYYIYHSSICTEQEGLFITATTHHLFSHLSCNAKRFSQLSLRIDCSISFKEKILSIVRVFRYQRTLERGPSPCTHEKN